MTAQELILVIEDLEADGWELERQDWYWLASHSGFDEAVREWYANHGDARDEALTAAERNF